MGDYKKKYSELLALYTLEKNINDIYVEGTKDQTFYSNYIKNKKLNCKTVLIDAIDLSGISPENTMGYDIRANKNKAIIFSKLLTSTVPTCKVRCLIDKDFDGFVEFHENQFLLRTDFSCIESYLLCEEVLEKFLEVGIGNFPIAPKKVISEIGNVLKHMFCLRLLRIQYFVPAKLVQIDGNISIDKQTGEITFDKNEYLQKFIHKNKINSQKEVVFKNYDELYKRLNTDIRYLIQGHDFIKVFFLYIEKIKNTHNYKSDNFERAIFLTVETIHLDKHPLFQTLNTLYAA